MQVLLLKGEEGEARREFREALRLAEESHDKHHELRRRVRGGRGGSA